MQGGTAKDRGPEETLTLGRARSTPESAMVSLLLPLPSPSYYSKRQWEGGRVEGKACVSGYYGNAL